MLTISDKVYMPRLDDWAHWLCHTHTDTARQIIDKKG